MSTLTSQPGNAARWLSLARSQAGLSLRALAQRAGTSHATLAAYEQGRKEPGTATFFRILDATGHAVDLNLVRRVRQRNNLERGEELLAALTLAAQFPARRDRTLEAPRLADHDRSR